MLFNLFTRSPGTGSAPAVVRRPPRAGAIIRPNLHDSDFEPAPLPEVKEGNGPDDWALWEDSVAAFEQSFGSRGQVRPRSGPADDGAAGEIDVYATVRKRDP